MKRELENLLPGVHQQAEANEDDQQVDIGGLVPSFVHRIVDGLVLVAQDTVITHLFTTTTRRMLR